jgi:uncharacterized protein YndB with AHSA1/START domain
MPRVEVSTMVQRPIEEVFAVLSDASNTPKWSSGMQTVAKTSDGPTGVGTTYHYTSKLFGRRLEGDSKVTAYETDRRLAVASTAPFPVTITMAMEQVDGGTRVEQTVDAEPGGFFKLAQPLLSTMMKRQVQGDLETFRDLMDAHVL